MSETRDTVAETEQESVEQEAAAEVSVEQLQAALEQAQARAQENWDQLLRARAEAENIRRRAEKDLESAHKYALEKFVNELLPIVDSIELGLAAINGDSPEVAKFREGSELTLKMFLAALEKFNVSQINPQGEKFNPDLHQAMSIQENSEVEPNTVLAVVQKGYTLQGRLVRPALVIVSKGGEQRPKGGVDERA